MFAFLCVGEPLSGTCNRTKYSLQHPTSFLLRLGDQKDEDTGKNGAVFLATKSNGFIFSIIFCLQKTQYFQTSPFHKPARFQSILLIFYSVFIHSFDINMVSMSSCLITFVRIPTYKPFSYINFTQQLTHTCYALSYVSPRRRWINMIL